MAIRLYTFVLLFLSCSLAAQVTTIQTARNQSIGSTITVRGIITSGSELGIIRYLQDSTAGIAAYPGSGSIAGFADEVCAGDSIEVTGTLVDYHGLLEINPITGFTKIASGLTLPEPKMLQLSDISDEYESQLVSFECLVFAAGGGTFSSGGYTLSDDYGSDAKLYIHFDHPLLGSDIPGTPIYLRSILSQYNDFQLLARGEDDFSQTLCFYFTEQLQESNISTTGFDLFWETNLPATTKLHYGTTPALGSVIDIPGSASTNNYSLTGLEAGTIYWVQVASAHNGNVTLSQVKPFATQSLSTGEIKVFFNHDIDPAYANGFVPDGTSSAALLDEIIARIDSAQETIDVAVYNNNRTDLTEALSNAHSRGVRVRYIADEDASNHALDGVLPFPINYSNSSAIMHNKFMAIDAEITDKSWLLTGSLNWTNQNVNTDFNNSLFIQDQSLVRGYTIEFEEMWGSAGHLPEPQNSRFGSNKRDNTPHHYIIGGKPVSNWFSPSDHTTERIVQAVYEAENEALFATFSFTKDEIGDALVDVFHSNRIVRGIIENISDQGCEISYLISEGIDCRPHPITGELHHKYAVFDADGADPSVLTGSHNWSNAAETANDENTLIIHDYRLASLYKAEFEQRWQSLPVSTYSPKLESVRLIPNPVSAMLSIGLDNGFIEEVRIQSLLGKTVYNQVFSPNSNKQSINISTLAAGQYFIFIRTKNELFALPFQKI